MAGPISFDARDQILGSNTANNGVDTSAVTANADGSLVERLESIQQNLSGQEQVVFIPSEAPGVDEDGGRMAVAVAIVDRNSGPVASGSIDITGATVTLEKSTGGGAFSTAGITQPGPPTKSSGLVELDFDILAAEWQAGDVYRLKVSGITATVGSIPYYGGTQTWVNTILEDLDAKTAILSTQGAVGAMTDSAAYMKGSASSLQSYSKALIDGMGMRGGTLTGVTSTSSFADTGLAAFPTSFFIGATLIFITGANAGQSKPILTSTTGTGALTMAGAFSTTPSIGDTYAIVGVMGANGRGLLMPTTDTTGNELMNQVVGSKADAAQTTIAATRSLVSYAKGSLQVASPVSSTTTSSGTTTAVNDTARTEATNYWRGAEVQMRSGANAGLSRPIVASTQNTGLTVSPPFPNATGSGDTYVIRGGAGFLLDQSNVGTATITSAGGTTEQTVVDIANPVGMLQVFLDLTALTQNSTIKLYRKIDGTNPRLMKSYAITVGASDPGFYSDMYLTRNGLKVTITMTLAEGANRSVPYEVLADPLG